MLPRFVTPLHAFTPKNLVLIIGETWSRVRVFHWYGLSTASPVSRGAALFQTTPTFPTKRSIVWKERDRRILTASSEGQVYLWETCTGRRLPDTYQVLCKGEH